MLTMGQKLSLRREELGMTQAELADRSGVNPKTIAGWENDRFNPRFIPLCLVADVLELSLDYLAEGVC